MLPQIESREPLPWGLRHASGSILGLCPTSESAVERRLPLPCRILPLALKFTSGRRLTLRDIGKSPVSSYFSEAFEEYIRRHAAHSQKLVQIGRSRSKQLDAKSSRLSRPCQRWPYHRPCPRSCSRPAHAVVFVALKRAQIRFTDGTPPTSDPLRSRSEAVARRRRRPSVSGDEAHTPSLPVRMTRPHEQRSKRSLSLSDSEQGKVYKDWRGWVARPSHRMWICY
jgi:hypothetical protein